MNPTFSNQHRLWMFVASLSFLMILSGCPAKTTALGTVVDIQGKPLANVKVVISSGQRRKEMMTDAKGKFQVALGEICILMCAGGNPGLTFSKKGYAPLTVYVPWDKKTSKTFTLKPPTKKKTQTKKTTPKVRIKPKTKGQKQPQMKKPNGRRETK